MEFEEQITNVEVIVDRTPRVYLKWTNTEEGRDKNDCYERITIGVNTPYYVNTHNRNSLITYGHPFWEKLEKMYNDNILKQTSKPNFEWVCNECNFSNFTSSVSEEEIEQELHSCINCGCFEMHKKYINK